MSANAYVAVLWTAAITFSICVGATAVLGIWWLYDPRPVLAFHSQHILEEMPIRPGEGINLRIDVEKLRQCAGVWQPWLDGPVRQALEFPTIARFHKGDRAVINTHLEIPRWLPAGTYDVRVTAWYQCNPLRFVREDMPPVKLIVAGEASQSKSSAPIYRRFVGWPPGRALVPSAVASDHLAAPRHR